MKSAPSEAEADAEKMQIRTQGSGGESRLKSNRPDALRRSGGGKSYLKPSPRRLFLQILTSAWAEDQR
jgi:hypothetical protein